MRLYAKAMGTAAPLAKQAEQLGQELPATVSSQASNFSPEVGVLRNRLTEASVESDA